MQSIDIEHDVQSRDYADTIYTYIFWFSWNPPADYVERLVKAHHGPRTIGPNDEITAFGQPYIKSMTDNGNGQWFIIIVEPYLD